MFPALFIFSASVSVTYNLQDAINNIKYCATENTVLTLVAANRVNFLIVMNSKSAGASVKYASPVGSTPVMWNYSNPAIQSPTGNLEIISELTAGHCVSFAYIGIAQSACLSGLHVYVNSTFERNMTANQKLIDECVFFAPPSNQIRYNFPQCNLGSNSITVFHEQMDGIPYDTITGTSNPGWSSFSSRPWLFRLQTKAVVDDGFAVINGISSQVDSNIVFYVGEPLVLKAPQAGVLNHNYLIPIIGCTPALILVLSWIYGYKKIVSKEHTN